MKRPWFTSRVAVAALSLIGGNAIASAERLTAAEFTQQLRDGIAAALPETAVESDGKLKLVINKSVGEPRRLNLENSYLRYLHEQLTLDAAISEIAVAYGEMSRTNYAIETTRLVPVVKTNEWLVSSGTAARAMAEGVPLGEIFSPLGGDLIVVYAEDLDNTTRYLTPSEVKSLGQSKSDVHSRAIENLRRLLPATEVFAGEGFFRLSAGGDYDASLLLLDELWTLGALPLPDKVLVMVPARDVLLAASSFDQQGVANMRALAEQIASEAPYRLSHVLLVRRNGRFEVFEEAADR